MRIQNYSRCRSRIPTDNVAPVDVGFRYSLLAILKSRRLYGIRQTSDQCPVN